MKLSASLSGWSCLPGALVQLRKSPCCLGDVVLCQIFLYLQGYPLRFAAQIIMGWRHWLLGRVAIATLSVGCHGVVCKPGCH